MAYNETPLRKDHLMLLAVSLFLNLMLLLILGIAYRLTTNHIAELKKNHLNELNCEWDVGFSGGWAAGLEEGARKERLFALEQKYPKKD